MNNLYNNGEESATKDYCFPIPSSFNCSTAEATIVDNRYEISCTMCSSINNRPNGIDTTSSNANESLSVCSDFNSISNCVAYNTIVPEGFNEIQSMSDVNFACTECGASFYLDTENLGFRCLERKNLDNNCLTYSKDSDQCDECNQTHFLSAD